MKINSTMLLSGALIVAGVVAIIVRSQLSAPVPVVQQAVAPVKKTEVLVANRDLLPGEFIEGSALRWQTLNDSMTSGFYYVRGQASESQLAGATLRHNVQAGQPLSRDEVVKPGDPGFISAVLQPGMLAISVPTDAVASNAGLVAPGDRIDIILSLRRDDQSSVTGSTTGPAAPVVAAQTIARNLRVLAMDNETFDPPASDVQPGEKSKTDANSALRRRPYRTVTVEVTPAQAQSLAVAKEVGMLHLAQRSLTADSGTEIPPPQVTTLNDTTQIYRQLTQTGQQVKLFRGDKTDIQQFPNR